MKRRVFVCVCVAVCLRAISLGAQPARSALTIVNAGPQGEIASRAEGNEVRVLFSEPMVAIGRIPARVQPAFFTITPAVSGTFRWSGTTLLIFTPDPKRPLPFATTYTVAIDGTASALSGRKLGRPFSFSFTTPTVRLLATEWYRQGDRFDGKLFVIMRFNQRVRTADIAAHLSARFARHDWTLRELEGLRARLKAADPRALEQLNAKVAATKAVASSTAAVPLVPAVTWDTKRYPPHPSMVVLEASVPVPSESWVELTLDATLPSPAGRATPRKPQDYTLQVQPAFFVKGVDCATECNPDNANPIELMRDVRVRDFAQATSAKDVTTPGRQVALAKPHTPREKNQDGDRRDVATVLTLEDAGFDPQPPARTYAVTIDASLKSLDGESLGYTWLGQIDNWHRPAFTSFGDGHGVWETGGGALLPFYARNYREAFEWAVPIQVRDLMPTVVRLREHGFTEAPGDPGAPRQLGVAPDRVQSHGLDISKGLRPRQTGLVWAAVRPGAPLPRTKTDSDVTTTRASIVQVTNLGISVKDSPQNTLVFVTRLDNGAPVAGAAVSIVRLDNSVFWRGTTGADGIVVAADTPLRDPDKEWERFKFLVTAEKDGDIAYVASDWTEGTDPWEFGARFDLGEATPMLRGTVFTDRGVYRLGEEVHFKAVLRHNTANGIRLLPPGTNVVMSLRDSQDRPVDKRTVKLDAWSTAHWALTLPEEGSLGDYRIRAFLEADLPKAPALPRENAPDAREEGMVPYQKAVYGSFLVAAYRRPDFRVDVTLTSGTAITGTPLNGHVNARYLFGPSMGARPIKWTFSRDRAYSVPKAIVEKFPEDRWEFVGEAGWTGHHDRIIKSEETSLQKTGTLPLELPTEDSAGLPWYYALEGDVEDVSRQHIANRAGVTVHPAPWYVGFKRLPYFTEQKSGIRTAIVTVGLDGVAVAGVPVELELNQIQWNSVRRAEGGGFYTWDTERVVIPVGKWTVTTADTPVPFEIQLPNGGNFVLTATGRGDGGLFALTESSFYALGDGYTAWARFDHNRIELVPERKTWKPGDTARIMIQSPWETATALVTTEREGIRSHRQFALTSTQQSITVPITEADIPNVYVSVLLVKGRTVPARAPNAGQAGGTPESVALATTQDGMRPEEDTSDPGKPSFRLGYVELKVEDATKRLTVAVAANKPEYRPANAAKIDITVKDHQGRGTASEVTLWAVDYGVLSLTAYRTPDVLGSVYVEKALQVMNVDSRQRIISRRVLTPKGATDGGGGGADAGAGTIRRDFRVLAFWVGSVTTDGSGRASVNVTLPESLTTYRIMAVAGDRASRFGSGDSEVRINKPITLKPTWPRFLAVGDTAHFGAVVTSQLASGGTAVVTMKSLDPAVLTLAPGAQLSLPIGAGGSVEARFQAFGKAIGRARVQMTVRVGDETDAFEDVIPVEVLSSPETVAAYGEASGADATASETLTIPPNVVPGFGGLHVELASTALVGLGEGARYLVEYPYGCAEQKGSRAIALLLAADLGEAFTLPGMDPAKMKPAVQRTLKELEAFQCDGGGFAYWPGSCWSTSAYLTAYLLHVFKTAADLKYDVNPAMRDRAYGYLESQLGEKPPENEGWWPSYTAWQAFAVKVLAEGGRNQDSNINRLYGYRDRMPIFALAYLHDAVMAKGETASPRAADLRRRMRNAILPEAGSSHVEELTDPSLLWYWSSNARSTAIVLNSLVRAGASDLQGTASAGEIQSLVRWLMRARKNGRWGNTQENAYAMEALVAYYRKYEATVPDFSAVVKLGADEIAREQFRGRSAESQSKDIAMSQILDGGAAGSSKPLTFTRQGAGTLFYTARFRYAADSLFQQGLDSGFNIERSYAPYVESGTRTPAVAYSAGDLVRVTLTFRLTKERRFVAVTDPLPAGLEPVESWFATTARSLTENQDQQTGSDGWRWWQRGGFDHVERHDDRVELFATSLGEGRHTFSYIARATTAGLFRTAPARAEEMYSPEVFGRTATAIIEIRK